MNSACNSFVIVNARRIKKVGGPGHQKSDRREQLPDAGFENLKYVERKILKLVSLESKTRDEVSEERKEITRNMKRRECW